MNLTFAQTQRGKEGGANPPLPSFSWPFDLLVQRSSVGTEPQFPFERSIEI